MSTKKTAISPRLLPAQALSDFWGSLLPRLAESRVFSPIFLYVAHSGVAKALHGAAAARLLSAIDDPRAIVPVRVNPNSEITPAIEEAIASATQLPNDDDTKAHAILWLDLSSGETMQASQGQWDHFRRNALTRLNTLRGRFERSLLAPLVIVLPELSQSIPPTSWVREVANNAPDLWTIRQINLAVPDGVYAPTIVSELPDISQPELVLARKSLNKWPRAAEAERWFEIVAAGRRPTARESVDAIEALEARGDYLEARTLARRWLDLVEIATDERQPNSSTELSAASSWAARTLEACGEYAEAEPLFRRALKIDVASYGADHPVVAIDLNNLAGLLQLTNRVSEAELLYIRALKTTESYYGAEHPSVATSLNNLATLLRSTNRASEAEPVYRRALKIDETSYGADHPTVAIRLSNLARLLESTNRISEAEPLFRRALKINELRYGADHSNVANCLNNLAQLLRSTNRLGEAGPLFRRALEIYETSYGADHPTVAIILNNLAGLLQSTNRTSDAESLYRRALKITETSYGADHPTVAIRLNNLAESLHSTNRASEAEPLSRRHLEIFVKFALNTGHEHPHLRAAIVNYRGILNALKLTQEEIETRLREVLAPLPPEILEAISGKSE